MVQVCHRRVLFAVLSLVAFLFAEPAGAAPKQPFHDTQKFLGHREGVICVTFTPDSTRIVSGGYDKSIRVWDVATGKCLRIIEGHTGPIRSVAVSRDGKWIASGSDDSTARVWELETGDQIAQLDGHTQQVRGVKFTPDGTLVSSGGGGVRVWDVKNEKLLWKIPEESYVCAMAVSEDGNRLAYTIAFGTTAVWDLHTHKQITLTGGAITIPNAIGLSPDGKTLFAEGLGGTPDDRKQLFERLDLTTGKHSPMPGDMVDPRDFVISSDGSRAVTARGNFEVWDTHTWKVIATFYSLDLGDDLFHKLDISRDGSLIVACGGGFIGDDRKFHPGKENVIALYRMSDTESKLGPIAGNISWEAIPTTVKTQAGRTVNFEDYKLYGDYDRGNGTFAAGNADLIFSPHAVLFHREKGVLIELFAGADKKVTDAIWDGKSVWIADAREGVIAIDPSTGNEVARAGTPEGLPRDIQTMRLYPISTDRILAAATTKAQVGWCGVLTRGTASGSAIQAQTLMSPDKLPEKWTGPFRPEWITEPPFTDKKLRGILVVCTAVPSSQPMLWIDVETLTPRPFNFVAGPDPMAAAAPVVVPDAGAAAGAPVRRGRAPTRRPGQLGNVVYWLKSTAFLDVNGAMLRRGKLTSSDIDDADMERIYNFATFGNNVRLLDQDGSLYLIGRRWMRIDPVMSRMQDLGPSLHVDGEYGDSAHYFKSALLGIAAITRNGGGFYRFSADPNHPLPIHATAALIPGTEIPSDGVYEVSGNNASFYCGEGAVLIGSTRVSEIVFSVRWRLPAAERDAYMTNIFQISQNAKTLGIDLTPAQMGKLSSLYFKTRMTPDAAKFQQLYSAFKAAKDEPAKKDAGQKILDEVRAYGQLRSQTQKTNLAAMQEAVSPELWNRLQPRP